MAPAEAHGIRKMLLNSDQTDEKQDIAVLLVEDEPVIREYAAALVKEVGLAVYEAANADEAIRVLEQQRDVRIVVTDVTMPGSMNGLTLAHYVRRRWPPVKIIITTGQGRLNDDMPIGAGFIAKPYRADQIQGRLLELAEA